MPVAADDHVVKVTPLGSHDGELCSRDRALPGPEMEDQSSIS
ncbi:hypothetical protein [Marinobacter sp. F3R08]|nr:hypothetical protein [Marinobacter sp. F3R08]